MAGRSVDRAPSKVEQAFCRTWLDRQIELVDPKIILLFGKLSIDTFLGPAPLDVRIGQVFDKDGKTYVPLPHSSGASTWLNVPEHRDLLSLAIEQIAQLREKWERL